MTGSAVPDSRRRPSRGLRVLVLLVLLLAGGAALWTWFALKWSYSDGERAGVLQKFSRRGWLCKTEEGELAQYVVAGVSPQIWTFSVRDPKVAADLRKVVGERVQLHYTEHQGLPGTCFGDTRYFVDAASQVASHAPLPAAPVGPAAPAPVPSP